MIYFFVGDNSFESGLAVRRLTDDFDGPVDTVDGADLSLEKLADLLTGTSLFSEKRMVVIKSLSENKAIWDVFDEWADRVSDDVSLVIVEPNPDKRTRAYKALHKKSEVKDFKSWGERDDNLATKWLQDEAKAQGVVLTPAMARLIVQRVGVDQWQLYFALKKLVAVENIDQQTIENIIDEEPSAQVFGLFEASLRGDMNKIRVMIHDLAQREDAYRTFGLLSGQAMQLVALICGDGKDVAKDLGVHPYAVSKLRPLAYQLKLRDAKRIIDSFAKADDDMKSSGEQPWNLIERALVQVATTSK